MTNAEIALSNPENEEIEGFEDEPNHGLGNYPLESVQIRTETRTLFEVKRRIDSGTFILNPDFQRDFVWDKRRRERLIESCLMRIPLPVFYLAEKKEGNVVIVDGMQRLTTFSRYLDNKFALHIYDHNGKIKEDHPLNGKKFKDLPAQLQNRIEDTQLELYIIDSNVDDIARLDIFERVNSSVPLTRQQMRHALFTGKATKWLKEQSECAEFKKATGEALDKKKMRDREVINRFCSFYIQGNKKYTDNMDGFLAEGLSKMNAMSDDELATMAEDFRRSMTNNYLIFGSDSFRKPKQGERRSIFNVGLFDVFSVGLTKIPTKLAIQRADTLKEEFHHLMHDEKYWEYISRGTNTPGRVHYRFKHTYNAIKKVFPEC